MVHKRKIKAGISYEAYFNICSANNTPTSKVPNENKPQGDHPYGLFTNFTRNKKRNPQFNFNTYQMRQSDFAQSFVPNDLQYYAAQLNAPIDRL